MDFKNILSKFQSLNESESSAQALAAEVKKQWDRHSYVLDGDMFSTEDAVDAAIKWLKYQSKSLLKWPAHKDKAPLLGKMSDEISANKEAVISQLEKDGHTSWEKGTGQAVNEGDKKERPYICVHAKKYAPYECHAKTSYEAAKKAAEHWGMKSTAGIDVHPAEELTAVNEERALAKAPAALGSLATKGAKAFRPIEDTEEIVKKATYKGVPIIVTYDQRRADMYHPFNLYINFDHHDEYEKLEDAIHDAKYEIDYNIDFPPDTDPDQMRLFKESKPVNESLKDIFNRLSTELLGENQITMSPAQQNTQVIKKDDQVIGTVTNPGLASQLKRGIESGEVSLSQEMNEDSGHSILDVISPEELEELRGYVSGDSDNFYGSEVYNKLYNYYLESGELPVSIAKARTGDPDQWILDRVEQDYGSELSESENPQHDGDKSEEDTSDEELLSMLSDKDSDGSERDKERELLRNLYNMTKHEEELDETSMASMPNHDSDFGANLGAGRSSVTLEGVDNKKGKKEMNSKKLNEGAQQEIEAARLLGKAHGLKCQEYYGKTYENPEEARAYHEGYKEGLDQCVGMPSGMPHDDMSMDPSMAIAEPMSDPMADPLADPMDVPDELAFDLEEEETHENAFTSALANTEKGEKFTVGGKTFTNRADIGEETFAFEAWDRELKDLLNEEASGSYQVRYLPLESEKYKIEKGFNSKKEAEAWIKGENLRDRAEDVSIEKNEPVNEGMSVSISKGQQHTPDQVTVTASDSDADELMSLIKTAGLGMFGDEQPVSDYGSPEVEHPEIGDHDQMMALIKSVDSHSDEHSVCSEEEEIEEAAPLAGAAVKAAAHGAGSAVAHRAMDKMSEDSEDDDVMDFLHSLDEGEHYVEEEDLVEETDSILKDQSGRELEVGDLVRMVGNSWDSGEDYLEWGMAKKYQGKVGRIKDLDSRSGTHYGIRVGYGWNSILANPEDLEIVKKADDEPMDEGIVDNIRGRNYDRLAKRSQDKATDAMMKAADFDFSDLDNREEHEDEFMSQMAKRQERENKANKLLGRKASDEDLFLDDEHLNEWANDAGKKGTDEAFEQDIEFMTKVISGGLNKQKQDQTTLPHTKVKVEGESPDDWKKLAGIK